MSNVSTAWFVGEGSLLTQAADAWMAAGHAVRGIASQEPNVVEWATQRGLTLVPARQLESAAADAAFDYLFSVVNLTILPERLIGMPRVMSVNFHDGPLPSYAGVNATVWALLNREARHGVTWHQMTAAADEGDILVQRLFDVAPDETAFSLNAKCFAAGIETFQELTGHITNGTLAPTRQNLRARSYFDFYERPPHAMVIDWQQPAEHLEVLCRALDFGGYPNPVGLPKVLTRGGVLVATEARALESRAGVAPGTVVRVSDEGQLVIGTSTDDIEVRLSAGARTADHGVEAGTQLPLLDDSLKTRLTEANSKAARSEGAILRQLNASQPLSFWKSGDGAAAQAVRLEAETAVAPQQGGAQLPALVVAFAARYSGLSCFDIAYADPAISASSDVWPGLFASQLPLSVSLVMGAPLESALLAIEAARTKTARRFPFSNDLLIRYPRLAEVTLPVSLLVDVSLPTELPLGQLAIVVDTQRATIKLVSRSDRASQADLSELAHRLALFIERSRDLETPLGRVQLLSDEEQHRILVEWNATERPVSLVDCLHTLFRAQASGAGDKLAVTAAERSLTYRELDRRSNALAHLLVEQGVGPDFLVGIFMGRSVDLAVAVLAVHKAGGAYVPLDPSYPRERIAFMLGDADLRVVLTDSQREPQLPGGSYRSLVVDSGISDEGRDDPPSTNVQSANLAYVIYTSGSTGTPKGVMVEHRNVVNFLAGMDDVLRVEQPGTWLAVTSLSFDISVLELLWTLTRGFHVVIHGGESATLARPQRRLDFSAFYFSSNDSGGGPEHYRLLFEGARFADEHGFAAVWTPERHFHEFGGLYPNPSVMSAALAMVTKKVGLRAGSCVSPLHSPIRIAEEWSVVDNLSNGRVGISFASGWQPNDFAIRPEAFRDRKQQMFDDIDVVRRLWRGERVQFKGGVGKDVGVSTLPRPVQPELPIWVTAAGNPETFEAAGAIGANLLTHLLGQTFEEVAEKIRVYRVAREKAGHAGRGIVSLMLHTFVSNDAQYVKETVRQPMKEYLRSAVGLVKQAAWSFPTFKQKFEGEDFAPDKLTEEEMDSLLEYAFERYYKMSGLFGTVEDATRIAQQVREIDVDDIACLIDFGVETETVLKNLPFLAQVLTAANQALVPAESATGVTSPSVGKLFSEYPITHFQCTPSMMSLLLADPEARAGLGRLDRLLVGGEALPLAMARELAGLVRGRVVNVYGPTETTVWSSTWDITSEIEEVAIGRPIANTELLTLDSTRNVAPPGAEGEICIGGRGVVRGYLGREELTNERFIAHPWKSGARLYRTGDLGAFDKSGVLHFRGRLDYQVKVRGYRIELGEIEARLAEHPHVKQCVVIGREDTPGDKRLVAYLIADKGPLDPSQLRSYLAERLPEYMVPTNFVVLSRFPETPNRKIDRNALPAPLRATPAPVASGEHGTPANALEETIAGIWREVLNAPNVGVNDNFFDVGGHSLLTIQVLGQLRKKISQPVTLVDLFGHPTIRGLAEYLAADKEQETLDASAARGARRRALRGRRR